MNSIEKSDVILFIRPNAKFALRGDELEWLDESQTKPTDVEIEAAWSTYQTVQATQAAAKATAKAALLTQLGITEEQAKLLLS